MQKTEEVKTDKCEEIQQSWGVTLQSVKEPPAETNSIDNEVLLGKPAQPLCHDIIQSAVQVEASTHFTQQFCFSLNVMK